MTLFFYISYLEERILEFHSNGTRTTINMDLWVKRYVTVVSILYERHPILFWDFFQNLYQICNFCLGFLFVMISEKIKLSVSLSCLVKRVKKYENLVNIWVTNITIWVVQNVISAQYLRDNKLFFIASYPISNTTNFFLYNWKFCILVGKYHTHTL